MGQDWYQKVNAMCGDLARQHGLTLRQVAGIVVSLSAQKSWAWNELQTRQFLAGEPLTGMVSTSQIETCLKIRSGVDPLDIWGKRSMKYRNFFASILLQEGAVCIDTHMIRYYCRTHPHSKVVRWSLKEKVFASEAKYNVIAKWVAKQAKKDGMKTFEKQAQLWVEIRGKEF